MVFQQVAKLLAENIDVEYKYITPETELIGEDGVRPVDAAKLVYKLTSHLTPDPN